MPRVSKCWRKISRLLYVAMTRAADQLIVCGYRGVRLNTDTWHAMITAAMDDSHPHVEAATFTEPDGDWQGVEWRVPTMERMFERADRRAGCCPRCLAV